MPLMSNEGPDLSSVVARVEQQVTAMLEDELVVLNMNDSKYHALNGIGAFIWRSIEDQGSCRRGAR
jgi:Coenzyme PQQ synthesis protein D (PqqD)